MLETPAKPEEKERIKLRILCADDDSAVRDTYSDLFSAWGCEVVVVKNGVELLKEFSESDGSFDLIITDNNMPIKNGIEAIEEIRDSENGKTIPIIIFSTFMNDELTMRAKNSGVESYSKPPSWPKLKERLREIAGAAKK